MLLYLVQHGKAKTKDEDSDRPLTDEGRREIDAVMLLMMRYGGITATRVVHSGKLRAAQTARQIADKLDVDVEASDGLSPMDDPAIWADRLGDEAQDIMLVGHLPHLSRLASLLLCHDPEAGLVDFTNAAVTCLEREDGSWAVRWSIPPALVK